MSARAQRASAGLILSEGIPIDPLGVGYANVPGLWSKEQTEAWKPITAAVHNAGGRIFAQIWHVGRISDPIFLNGQLPVAPSAIAAAGTVSLVRPQKNFVTPRALDITEIPGISPQVLGFADRVVAVGCTAVLPDLFGEAGRDPDRGSHGWRRVMSRPCRARSRIAARRAAAGRPGRASA